MFPSIETAACRRARSTPVTPRNLHATVCTTARLNRWHLPRIGEVTHEIPACLDDVPYCIWLGPWRPGFGLRASAPPSAPAENAEEVIVLPEFSVGSSSTDNSWVASSSMSGTRTNVPIQNLPRSIQVLTSEFLADNGADNMADAAAFMTGVTSQGKQDAVFDNNTLRSAA